MDFIRDEVVPAVQAMPGCIGMSMMADRKSGRCIVTSAWESQDEMRASDAAIAPLRERAGKLLGGCPFVEEWEIAVLHRNHHSHQGACVRATWMHGDPAATDRGVDMFRMATLPAMENLDGFCSASLFVDRTTGRAVISATYDTRRAMEASREPAMELRDAHGQGRAGGHPGRRRVRAAGGPPAGARNGLTACVRSRNVPQPPAPLPHLVLIMQ